MKNITNTLGRVIVVIAAVALLIGVVGVVAAPGISGFMGSVTSTMTDKGDDMLNSIGTPHAQGTPKLETPVVTLSGNTLTITPVANATSYRVYNGNDLLVETAETTVDLATYLPNVGNYSIRVMAMAAGYKDSGNAQVDYIKQLVPGLYETGSNYTVLKKDWNTLISEGIITADGKIVSGKTSSLAGDLMISDEITAIVDNSYKNCTKLTGVIVPDSVTSIGTYAFTGCTILKDITLPNSVTTIASTAFMNCTEIRNISVSSENSKYHSDGNCLIETASKTLVLGCRNSVIPSDGSVTVIGDFAFYQCSYLESVGIVGSGASIELPSCVISISNSAFNGCNSLTSVTIPDSIETIGVNAFASCIKLKDIEISNSVKSIGQSAFKGCTSLVNIVIPDSVTSIGTYAFSGCANLTNITLSNNITSLGQKIFEKCYKLANVTIPNSVKSIGDNAFDNCMALTSITIPDSVTSIGLQVFNSCTYLTSVTIPGSVNAFSNGVFAACTNLSAINFEGTVAQWNTITKPNNWNYNCGEITVTCTGDAEGNGAGTVIVPAYGS